MTRYESMFRRLKAQNEGAFVPFVMLFDPNKELSERIIETLIESGADALELGIPFSDPIADGPVIQRAALRSLAHGATPKGCLELIRAIRARHSEIPIGVLTYANLVWQHGLERFYQDAAACGVDSVLVADVPTLEAAPFCHAASSAGVDPVLIVPPNVSEDRLKQIAQLSKGYVYVVTRKGVTGADRTLDLPSDDVFGKLRAQGGAPGMYGFGISSPQHVQKALNNGAQGAISGSALTALIEQGGPTSQLLEKVGEFCRQMKAATRLAGN